jgi:hypothetical protein
VHPSKIESEKECTITVDGLKAKIPILEGTDGNKMLDI